MRIYISHIHTNGMCMYTRARAHTHTHTHTHVMSVVQQTQATARTRLTSLLQGNSMKTVFNSAPAPTASSSTPLTNLPRPECDQGAPRHLALRSEHLAGLLSAEERRVRYHSMVTGLREGRADDVASEVTCLDQVSVVPWRTCADV